MRLHAAISTLLVGLWCVVPLYAQDEPPEEDAEPVVVAAPEEPKAKGKQSIKQVQISVWIVETNTQGLRELGANLQYTRFDGEDESGGSIQQISTGIIDTENPDFRTSVPEPTRELFPGGARPDLDEDAPGLQTQQGGGLEFTIINTGSGTLDGVFRSNSRKSRITLVSRPELLVINEKKATIHAGGEVPFQGINYNRDSGRVKLKDGQPQLEVRWEQIGVLMELTPTIMSNNLVQIHLEKLEVSDLARIDRVRGIELPVFSKRSQTGWVVVPNRSTLVVGGLTSLVDRFSTRRVPILGKLPLIGIPFRSRRSDNTVSHLLIFISPTIVDLRNMTPQVEEATNFYLDEDWDHSADFEGQKKKNPF